jgi:hypothetical protein
MPDRRQPRNPFKLHRVTGWQAGALLTLLLVRPAVARGQTTLEVYTGTSFSLPLPVTISQSGSPDLHFTAHFHTDPWQDTWYYQFRLGVWKGNRAWLIEVLHHKLYLDDDDPHPPEVQRFDITNGWTMLSLSRGWRFHQTTLEAGAGFTVVYPITNIRGRRNGNAGLGGYHLSGINLVGTINQRFPLSQWLFLALESRGSVSYARVPISGGHASVPNAALHFHVGAGVLVP